MCFCLSEKSLRTWNHFCNSKQKNNGLHIFFLDEILADILQKWEILLGGKYWQSYYDFNGHVAYRRNLKYTYWRRATRL